MEQSKNTTTETKVEVGETSRYEKLKKWYTYHREKIIHSVSLVLVFLVGFGTGRAQNDFTETGSIQLHNTTKTTENTDTPTPPPPLVEVPPPVTISSIPAAVLGATDCPIKGNISGKNKIYHLRGGAFYERTQAEQCFNTEDEAKSAGFRASSR